MFHYCYFVFDIEITNCARAVVLMGKSVVQSLVVLGSASSGLLHDFFFVESLMRF